MASSPITSWQTGVGGGNVNSDRFIFLGSKITADNDYIHEIQRCFLLWKKSNDKARKHIKKQRHHFADTGPYSQSYLFSVFIYGCENWTIEKAEHGRIDTFKL